jgi:hypothetical protein
MKLINRLASYILAFLGPLRQYGGALVLITRRRWREAGRGEGGVREEMGRGVLPHQLSDSLKLTY